MNAVQVVAGVDATFDHDTYIAVMVSEGVWNEEQSTHRSKEGPHRSVRTARRSGVRKPPLPKSNFATGCSSFVK
jgi:hypothetical protein